MNRPPTQPLNKTAWWGVGAIILALAALLRFLALGKLELWLDENYSVVMALYPAGVLRGALGDTNPPLYLYLLKGWIALFGLSAAAVRSLSAVLGVAQLAVLGAWLARLGLPRRAALWAMLLGALAPLHIYYSQEARSYTLIWLLFTLALWSFTAAAQTGRPRAWMAHALCLVLALYTHNIFLFFIPGFWMGGWILRLDRRGWASLAAAHALAGLLFFPWFYMTVGVVRGGTLGWIAENWSAAQAPRLIPASLEALATGGAFPLLLRMLPPSSPVRLAALAWLLAILAALFSALIFGVRRLGWAHHCVMGDSRAIPGPDHGRAAGATEIASDTLIRFLSVFILLPLLLMLAFSLLGHPIYVVGRYDTLVFPPLLALLGLGAWGLESALDSIRKARLECELQLVNVRAEARTPNFTRRGLAAALILLPPLMICISVVQPRLTPFPPGEQHYPQRARGEVLRDVAAPDDLIVCLGLEGGKIAYQMLRFRIKAEMLTYPLATGGHLGYFLPREVVRDPAQLNADARAILDRFAAPGTNRQRRLWVMMDPFSFRPAAPGSLEEDYTKISSVLLGAIDARGFRRWGDAAFLDRTSRLGIRVYTQF